MNKLSAYDGSYITFDNDLNDFVICLPPERYRATIDTTGDENTSEPFYMSGHCILLTPEIIENVDDLHVSARSVQQKYGSVHMGHIRLG